MRGAPPPGGPLNPDFRHAIEALAEQAREEDLRAAEELRKRNKPRPVQRFIYVGLLLITLQSALFIYLYTRGKPAVVRPVAVAAPTTCSGAVSRAYWQVVAYLDHEGHPPVKLEDLLPNYLDKLPADPVSGKPLDYTTDGTRFTLRCPGRGGR
jgi:hypothetical protein